MKISITYLFKNIWSKLKQVKLVYYQNNKKVWKSDGLATPPYVEKILLKFQYRFRKDCSTQQSTGVIHLVRTQNFAKNYHFLSPDTHTHPFMWVVRG